MDYELNKEQAMLKETARKFLSAECNGLFVREMIAGDKGYTDRFWQSMAELGWQGLLIPEAYEGFGAGFLEMVVLLYEMGYHCLPGPFFSTAVLGTLTLLECASHEQKETLLPGVVRGERLLTLAWLEANGRCTPDGIHLQAHRQGQEYLLTGSKLFVPYGQVAHTILCAARTDPGHREDHDGISLFMVEADTPGIGIHPLKTFTGEKLSEIIFDKVTIPAGSLLGGLNLGWGILKKVLAKAAVAKCAEMSGGAKKILETAVSYAKEREQFGQPIGAFQAIQHYCANMLMEADTCRLMTYQAAWRIDQGLPCTMEASMTKAWVSDSYQRLLAWGHQIMGGTGFMEEHDLHLYSNRGKSQELAFGDGDFHREQVARQLGL